MSIFTCLMVYQDMTPRTAAMNMAVDEALFESAILPSIRFYRWDHPALSFGYFGKYEDVRGSKRDIVRRWTGGGIVLHGTDLTYSIIVPASAELFRARAIYAKVHGALRDALAADGEQAELAQLDSTVISESCFARPVIADVLLNGRKIAGAAQRRTRRGLLQQGSIQQVELAEDFAARFTRELSLDSRPGAWNGSIIDRAEEIARERYGRSEWLQRR
jgi:lipoate-protein ligase A